MGLGAPGGCREPRDSATEPGLRERVEEGHRLMAERERLIAAGISPGVLDVPMLVPYFEPVSPVAAEVDRLLAELHREDARMRAEVLPAAPAGYEWEVALESSKVDLLAYRDGEDALQLVYRLRPVP